MKGTVLILIMLSIAYISSKVGKSLPKELALVPLIIMLMMDGIAIFLFKDLTNTPNKEIAISIMIATLVKVLFLTRKLDK